MQEKNARKTILFLSEDAAASLTVRRFPEAEIGLMGPWKQNKATIDDGCLVFIPNRPAFTADSYGLQDVTG
jgi:hypothetical protein